MHQDFIQKIKTTLSQDPKIIGAAAGGSYIDQSLDEYSDLDIHLVVQKSYCQLNVLEKLEVLKALPTPLTAYSNGHDNRVLICLYDYNPLILHVDWKWCSLEAFKDRVENPIVLFEKEKALTKIMQETDYGYPPIDYQEEEKRFWSWMHYILTKIGRGELIEAHHYLLEVQSCLLGPLFLKKNGLSPRRMRRIEQIAAKDWEALQKCLPQDYTAKAILKATEYSIQQYRLLSQALAGEDFQENTAAEAACHRYLKYIENKLKCN
jgi:hypothetical protein